MKKFLTFMMILITVMGIGFAANIGPNQANASLEFTFEWSGQAAEAKNFAGFYDSYLPGAGDKAGSHTNLEALDGKATIVGPIAIDKTTKTWAPGTVVYAAAGTNWITSTTDVELILDSLRAEGGATLGYTVDCTKTAATVAATAFTVNGGGDHFASKEPVEVTAGSSVTIATTLQATEGGAADPGEPQYANGNNGIMELKFENMLVDATLQGTLPYVPTKGIDASAIKNYKATWTFSIKAQ